MTGLELLKAPEATAGEIADIISAPCPPTIPAHCDGVSCRECWLTWLTGEPPEEKGPSDEQTAPCGGCPLQGKKRELTAIPPTHTRAARPPITSGTDSSPARRSSRASRLLCPPTSTATSTRPTLAARITPSGIGRVSILGVKRRIPRIRRTVRAVGAIRPATGTTALLRPPARASVSAPSLKS